MTIEAAHVFHSRKLNAINYTKGNLTAAAAQHFPNQLNIVYVFTRKANKMIQQAEL